MRQLAKAIDRHWFDPAPLHDLAIVRIVLAAATWFFVILREQRGLGVAAGAADALFQPLPALKVLLLPLGWGARPPYELLVALLVIAHAAALFMLIGLFSRVSTGVLAYAVTALITHRYSYGELHHPQTLIVIMLWVLALTPLGGALSMDARRRPEPGGELTMHARWPLRLGQWLLVLAYLSAAISKLEGGGLSWMNGTTLAYYLAYDGMMWDRPLGVLLAQTGWLMLALSVFTIVFELTFAAAVLVRRLTWLYLAAGAALHIGIFLAQRAPFFTFMALYIVFIPQLRENLAAASRRIRHRRTPGLAVPHAARVAP